MLTKPLREKLKKVSEERQINLNTIAEDTVDEFSRYLKAETPTPISINGHNGNGSSNGHDTYNGNNVSGASIGHNGTNGHNDWEGIYVQDLEKSRQYFDKQIDDLFRAYTPTKERAKLLLDGDLEKEIDSAIIHYRKNADRSKMDEYADLVNVQNISRGNLLLDDNHEVKRKQFVGYSALAGGLIGAGLGLVEGLTQANITGPLTPFIAGVFGGGIAYCTAEGLANDLKSRINEVRDDARTIKDYVYNKESLRSMLHRKAKF